MMERRQGREWAVSVRGLVVGGESVHSLRPAMGGDEEGEARRESVPCLAPWVSMCLGLDQAGGRRQARGQARWAAVTV